MPTQSDKRPTKKRRSAPGRPARLSRELIADAALELVAGGTLVDLTMRTLADRLDATPMALYKHVASRDELAALVVERSFADLALPAMELPAIEWLSRLARSLREIGLAYPGVMDFLLDHGPVVEPALRILDRTVVKLHTAGLGFREAAELHNTFFSWLASSVIRQQRALAAAPKAFRGFFEAARTLPAAEYPGLQRALPHMQGADFDREFQASLRFMLDAVALRIERTRSR
jgi:AcrR family transcriptional regulator